MSLTQKLALSPAAPAEAPRGMAELTAPVADAAGREPSGGIALCLSGGGYRAMLFHVGAILRLNELGWLGRLDRISSVSGGSIAAAVLGLNWSRLEFRDGVAARLQEGFVDPVRRLAGITLDEPAVVQGLVLPGSALDRVAAAYRRHLFGDATLQDLPDSPRFVINATNVQTKALWRFSKPYMADWRVGMAPRPRVALADAVAASSAFPPVLSPLRLKLDPAAFAPSTAGELARPPFTREAVLTDGGVYDNLGLEAAWKRCRTLLVSDGGGSLGYEEQPHRDWLRHTQRVLDLILDQVRSLRKRQLLAGYRAGLREGAYWGIGSDPAAYPAGARIPLDGRDLASVPTRLKALPASLQERLIEWGYAICDAAMRSYVCKGAAPPCPRFGAVRRPKQTFQV